MKWIQQNGGGGWKFVNNGQFLPVMTGLPPAPEHLLKIIRCNCYSDCSTSHARDMTWFVHQRVGYVEVLFAPIHLQLCQTIMKMTLMQVMIVFLSHVTLFLLLSIFLFLFLFCLLIYSVHVYGHMYVPVSM